MKAKPRDYDNEEGLRQSSNDENVPVQPTYSKTLRSNQPICKDKAQTGRTVLKSNSHQIEQREVENSNSNFLEIQELLKIQSQTMKIMQQQLMELMRGSSATRGRMEQEPLSIYQPRW